MSSYEEIRPEIDAVLDDIIAVVARENHQGLRKDDIVMVLPTIMKVITEDARKTYKATLQNQATEHEELALRWRMDAKEVAERILTTSLDAGRRQITEASGEVAEMLRTAVRSEVEVATNRLREELDRERRVQWSLWCGGGLAFLGGVATLTAVALKLL